MKRKLTGKKHPGDVCLKCGRKNFVRIHKTWSLCPECHRKYKMNWRHKNKLKEKKYRDKYKTSERGKQVLESWAVRNKLKRTKQRREEVRQRKLFVMQHYSKLNPVCACCNERNLDFLTIDHIQNNGAKHRKIDKIGHLYIWLIKNKFPRGFQVLCWNCNLGKAKNPYNVCPHEYA